MHEVRRMVATLREIFMNASGFFLRSNVNRNFLEVFQQNKTKTTIIMILLIANKELGKRLYSSIQILAISKLQLIVLF